MSRVAIITDTNNCLPPELMKEFGIRAVPLSLNIDGKPYRDQVDITPEKFWERYPTIKEVSTFCRYYALNPKEAMAKIGLDRERMLKDLSK